MERVIIHGDYYGVVSVLALSRWMVSRTRSRRNGWMFRRELGRSLGRLGVVRGIGWWWLGEGKLGVGLVRIGGWRFGL